MLEVDSSFLSTSKSNLNDIDPLEILNGVVQAEGFRGAASSYSWYPQCNAKGVNNVTNKKIEDRF